MTLGKKLLVVPLISTAIPTWCQDIRAAGFGPEPPFCIRAWSEGLRYPLSAAAPEAPAPASPEVRAPHNPKLIERTPETAKVMVRAQRHIHLDVLVTDGNGHPLSGLQQDAFTVLDDNAPRPVQTFRAVEGLAAKPPTRWPWSWTCSTPDSKRQPRCARAL